jgi:hypothetical protein
MHLGVVAITQKATVAYSQSLEVLTPLSTSEQACLLAKERLNFTFEIRLKLLVVQCCFT